MNVKWRGYIEFFIFIIVVMTVLVLIALPNFIIGTPRAYVAKTLSELKSITHALKAYHLEHQTYPPAIYDILTTPVAYLSSMPTDHYHGDEEYSYATDGQSYYILTSWGPDKADDLGSHGTSFLWFEFQSKTFPGCGFDERDYTGARFEDRRQPALRGGLLTLKDFSYQPSNGLHSAGDIILLNPKDGFEQMNDR